MFPEYWHVIHPYRGRKSSYCNHVGGPAEHQAEWNKPDTVILQVECEKVKLRENRWCLSKVRSRVNRADVGGKLLTVSCRVSVA